MSIRATERPSRRTDTTVNRHRQSVAFLVCACAVLGCGGQEQVLLYAPDAQDATAPDGAQGDPGDSGLADGSIDGNSQACALQPNRRCRDNGLTCVLGVECCSGRCASGVCLDPGTCAAAGTPCTSRSSCCSGRCEPVVGSSARACVDYCKADGAQCSRAIECCSMACHGGTCGGAFCTHEGEACVANADCCSGVCSTIDGKCALDPAATCRATGDACESSSPCCVACNTTNDRCDFGAGQCRPRGAICGVDGDCCRGSCVQGDAGVTVCTAPCQADGTTCGSAADCCSGRCGGSPPTCGAAVSECKLIGSSCANAGECCSGQCLEGACGSNCTPG